MSTAASDAKSLQSCPTLCDHIDGSPPGSPIPGILQARALEWVAVSFSPYVHRGAKIFVHYGFYMKRAWITVRIFIT